MADESASTQYLAEIFAPGCTTDRLRSESERLRAAARIRTRSGERVRLLHSLLVSCEETAFHFVEAERLDSVEHVLSDAGIDPERVSVVIPASGNSLCTASAGVAGSEHETPAVDDVRATSDPFRALR